MSNKQHTHTADDSVLLTGDKHIGNSYIHNQVDRMSRLLKCQRSRTHAAASASVSE